MKIVQAFTLGQIQEALVNATHSLTDEKGHRIDMGTIDPARLEMAALVGLQVALGDAVWPADRKITIPRRARLGGPFHEED